MPEIPLIEPASVRDLRLDGIPEVSIWHTIPSQNIPIEPPVTVQIGLPIIEMPGCVEAHPDNSKSKSLPKDDPRGVQIICDGNYPSFNAIDYTPENLILTKPASPPVIDGSKKEAPPSEPAPPPIPQPKIILPCPLPDAAPVGSMNSSRTKRITGYELREGECITLYEGMPIVEIINEQLPDIPIVITTATVAAVATISALLSKPLGDILLKAIKPTVKKVVKKIAAIRGKSKPVTPSQRRAEQRSLRK
jgi:hypothetical protein